jgi:peptidoglycan L-alanyl-D-glutamate endopeptidase CwlK
MEDQLKRLNTQVLYQPFVGMLRALLDACAARGFIYVATSGLRTYEQQNKLYAQGRTAPGGIVTNAKGGQSLHNFGIAVDFCRHDGETFEGKLKPDYRNSQYQVLGEEADKLGLEWGGAWKKFKDTPHIQLPYNKKHGLKLKDLDAAYREGGYEAVYDLLDKYGW